MAYFSSSRMNANLTENFILVPLKYMKLFFVSTASPEGLTFNTICNDSRNLRGGKGYYFQEHELSDFVPRYEQKLDSGLRIPEP